MSKTTTIIAAVHDKNALREALRSPVTAIFYLYSDIIELQSAAELAHKHNKRIYIHVDLTSGLGKDKSGMEFVKRSGIDGIISTRVNLIKAARECGLKTVQRFFIVDSRSVSTTIEAVKASKPDFVEIMPGIMPKIIRKLRMHIDTPIIAGGLVETNEEVINAIQSGVYAISTGCVALWS